MKCMEDLTISGPLEFAGNIEPPGDKSVTHRALVLGFLAGANFRLIKPNPGRDCRRTLAALVAMGLKCQLNEDSWELAPGPGWQAKSYQIYAGNSGTTARLLMGMAAWLNVGCSLAVDGDTSLRARPMQRVATPLAAMGLEARYQAKPGRLPLVIVNAGPRPGSFRLPVASAQIKSALLVAGLAVSGWTSVVEPAVSRDHTERMLEAMGVPVCREQNQVSVSGGGNIQFPACYTVPGDISAGAFWAAGAAIGGSVLLKDIGLNPGRTMFLTLLGEMGAKISYRNLRQQHGEPVGDVAVAAGKLTGVEVEPEQVPACIDELPLLAVVASRARGTTVIRGAEELRYKESDRLAETGRLLNAFGARWQVRGNDLHISGGSKLRPGTFSSSDHRLVMAAAVMATGISGKSVIGGLPWTAVSYPGFPADFAKLAGLAYNPCTGGRQL